MYDLSDEAIERALRNSTPRELAELNRILDDLMYNPSTEARREETRTAKQFIKSHRGLAYVPDRKFKARFALGVAMFLLAVTLFTLSLVVLT